MRAYSCLSPGALILVRQHRALERVDLPGERAVVAGAPHLESLGVVPAAVARDQLGPGVEADIPVKPDSFYRIDFDMQPKDVVVPAGIRLALMVLSSDRDFTIRPPAARS